MTFQLGSLMTTPGALKFCKEHRVSLLDLIYRHARGDWAGMHKDDQLANERAAREGDARILSAFTYYDTKLYVITEADRSVTTVLLASEY